MTDITQTDFDLAEEIIGDLYDGCQCEDCQTALARKLVKHREAERAKVVEFLSDLDPILSYAIETGEHWR